MQSQSQAQPDDLPRLDGFRFAESRGALRGKCKVSGFSRLKDSLNSTAGELEFELLGTADEAGRPAIRVKVTGELQLTCQRCLTALAHPLQLDELLVLARSEAEIESHPVDPEKPDRVVGEKEMEVGALLEDEILLAVPFAPRHEQCSPQGAGKGAAQASPFADLRGMLNKGSRARN